MSHFFIDRPIFAWVIAIVIMLGGVLAILRLPIAQYPQIAPPSSRITATYPGASRRRVENSVTQVIEQNMTGLDVLHYMSSSSTSTGMRADHAHLHNQANPDIAQVQVQNKLQLAMPLLPQDVQQQGITRDEVLVELPDGARLRLRGRQALGQRPRRLCRVARSTIRSAAVPASASVQLFGAEYAMRIWLDPDKLAQLQADADRRHRRDPGAERPGLRRPARRPAGRRRPAAQRHDHRAEPAADARAVRATSSCAPPPTAPTVRLGDVARVELGAESYDATARYNGKPAAGFGVSLATGANALDTAEAVKAAHRPSCRRYAARRACEVDLSLRHHALRASSRSRRSIQTLLEAIVLVFVVMFVFLQNWRATLIPTIAVPVVLLGTFGVLAVAGYSINTLTMFAMVLAIGLLVDDAIVVVENVERVMARGRPRRRARRPKSRWARSPARWSASRWCCRRCSCRWRSSAARSASSTASSRSPSSRRCCCRCWSRWS